MEQVRQGIGRRFIAAFIDAVILVVAGVVIGVVLHRLPYVMGVVSAAVGVAYMSLEIFRGQTVGKMVLKLKILSDEGTPATQAELLERFAVKNAASLVVLIGAITGLHFLSLLAGLIGLAVAAGALMMLRPDRLAFHDTLAGTAVYGPAEIEFVLPDAAALTGARAE